jgi:hypothetical protein
MFLAAIAEDLMLHLWDITSVPVRVRSLEVWSFLESIPGAASVSDAGDDAVLPDVDVKEEKVVDVDMGGASLGGGGGSSSAGKPAPVAAAAAPRQRGRTHRASRALTVKSIAWSCDSTALCLGAHNGCVVVVNVVTGMLMDGFRYVAVTVECRRGVA